MSNRVEFSDNSCITRIEEKCTNCGMCKKTCQRLHLFDGECIKCGQCILSCPMGAIVPVYHYQKVLNLINDTEYICVASIAPSVRSTLIDELNLSKNNSLEHLVGILKAIGFDYVFDVSLGADITTIEESLELIDRIKNKNTPLISSCCPSWKKYAIENKLDKYISSVKSPMMILGHLIKNYLPKYNKLDKKIISVMIMPCTSKKEEILENSDIDFVLTTRELLYMINEANIDFTSVLFQPLDNLLSNASSSGIIYGRKGGVLESILRTSYYLLNNENPDDSFLSSITKDDCLVDLKKIKIKVKKLETMKEVKETNLRDYDFIEVMACPNGCINGGGQPLVPINKNLGEIENRRSILNTYDSNPSFSYNAKEVNEIYKYYLGIPGGKNSKKKIHNQIIEED